MVRTMRFQSWLMPTGTTGWMLAVYFIAFAGPMPKSQSFWMGTLMRSATGFWSFLASSAALSCSGFPAPPPLEEVASAGARVRWPSTAELVCAFAVDDASTQVKASAAARRFCLELVFMP
jgi:hypothetical protein